MQDWQKQNRRNVFGNILKSLGASALLSAVGLRIVFSEEAQSLEGTTGLTLFVLAAAGIALLLALFSLFALFTNAPFVHTDGMLYGLVYFLPPLFASTFLFAVTLQLGSPRDKLMAVSLLPVCSFNVIWAILFVPLNRKRKTVLRGN